MTCRNKLLLPLFRVTGPEFTAPSFLDTTELLWSCFLPFQADSGHFVLRQLFLAELQPSLHSSDRQEDRKTNYICVCMCSFKRGCCSGLWSVYSVFFLPCYYYVFFSSFYTKSRNDISTDTKWRVLGVLSEVMPKNKERQAYSKAHFEQRQSIVLNMWLKCI